MSNFPDKHFEGILYDFGHLAPRTLQIPIGEPPGHIDLYVTFGWHCFTDGFDPAVHRDHHRYSYRTKGVMETRAFDLTRHACSLQLPDAVQAMLRGRIYHLQESDTYVAHIELLSASGLQPYSVFFTLAKSPHGQVCRSYRRRRPVALDHGQAGSRLPIIRDDDRQPFAGSAEFTKALRH